MPDGYAQRCRLGVLIDAQSLALLGGATITETPLGPRVARAWSADTQRPWTPAVASADQE